MFEIFELADALNRIYRPGVCVDTTPVRNILIPFVWITERSSRFPEIREMAKKNDQFAADMGRYILFMGERQTVFEPKGQTHRCRARYEIEGVRYRNENDSEGCMTCPEPGKADRYNHVTDTEPAAWFNPFATVLVWKHTQYWCRNCARTMDRSIPPWRLPEQEVSWMEEGSTT